MCVSSNEVASDAAWWQKDKYAPQQQHNAHRMGDEEWESTAWIEVKSDLNFVSFQDFIVIGSDVEHVQTEREMINENYRIEKKTVNFL